MSGYRAHGVELSVKVHRHHPTPLGGRHGVDGCGVSGHAGVGEAGVDLAEGGQGLFHSGRHRVLVADVDAKCGHGFLGGFGLQ